MTQDQLREVFAYHNWRQRIPLKNGYETPGTNFAIEWENSFLPDNLEGQTFLDVGSNDGMFSFLAESKGATKVVATDVYTTQRNSHMTFGWNKTGIDIASKIMNSQIEIHDFSIYELDRIEGKFDFVFCSNVLAWLKDPLSAVQQLASKSCKTLHLREDLSLTDHGQPELRLVHNFENPTSTCYYNPNKEWFEVVLRGLGFNSIEFKLIDEKQILKHRQSQFPKYKIPKGTPIWSTPFDSNPSNFSDVELERRSTHEYSTLIYFPAVGWIEKKDCTQQVSHFHESNKLKSSIKRIMGRNEDWKQNNYAIIAQR